MDEESALTAFWQDDCRFTQPPHSRSRVAVAAEAPKPVDWPPEGVATEGRLWLQQWLRTLEPAYLYMRLLCVSSVCGEAWRSVRTKRFLSWLPLVLICLMGVYIGYLLLHATFGQLHDPFQPHLTQAQEIGLTSHILDNPAELSHLAKATETSLLTYMKVHPNEVCKLTRQHYVSNGEAALMTIIAIRQQFVDPDMQATSVVQLMWNPRINNVTYEWYNRVWTSITYKAVEDVRPLLCPPHSYASNDTSLHVGLLDEIVFDYNTAWVPEFTSSTPSPTIHTGTFVKPVVHCIQEELLRNNLVSREFINSAYEFDCEDVVENDSF